MSYAGEDFPLMAPDESSGLGFDFTKKFTTSGETISSAAWSLAAFEGTDASASSHLGSSVISGLICGIQVSGLLDGVVYRIRCLATSSLGNIRAWHSYIPSKAPLGADT